MKQLFKPQLKMEQFIFKLELPSAEQEGRQGGCTGTPGATQGRLHWPLEPHCSEEEGRGTEQRFPTAPQRGASCSLPIPQLPLTGTDHSSPSLTSQSQCCHMRDEDLGCSPWEGLALAPQPGSAPPHLMGEVFWEASAPLGSFHSNQGLLFFPTRCPSPQPQVLHPKTSPVCPREVTTSQHAIPRAGSTLDSKRWLGGSWGGREGGRKSSNHNKNPPSLFIRQQNLSACSPSHLSPHTK